MIISSEILKYLKDIPNSTYESIKTEFLYHSNKIDDGYETIHSIKLWIMREDFWEAGKRFLT